MVDKEVANHDVGVDTGRLIGSLQFGPTKGTYGETFNDDPIEKINMQTMTLTIGVGSAITYAKYFDKLRKIVGPKLITPERQRILEERIIKPNMERILKEELRSLT